MLTRYSCILCYLKEVILIKFLIKAKFQRGQTLVLLLILLKQTCIHFISSRPVDTLNQPFPFKSLYSLEPNHHIKI
jgi:hypothetical protein